MTATSTETRSRFSPMVLAAFFAIYVIWGSTFLAIRTAVLLIPPWFAAGTRFFTAGVLLYGFMRLRGATAPTSAQWRNLAILGVLMFSCTYGALFWGEQYVPSGITSVLEACLPIFTILLEIFVLRQQPFRWRVIIAAAVGLCGVALMILSHNQGTFRPLACFVILSGSLSWCVGAVLTRSFSLPHSRPLTAGAEMMIGGAILLALSAATGELHPFPLLPAKAVFALVYLITFGSIIGFTAFVWLLAHMPASKVASHAYVNPVVALFLGHFVAGERITLRILAGASLVIFSVFLTLRKD